MIAKRLGRGGGSAGHRGRLQPLRQLLITPPIPYSEPALEGRIQYLYAAVLDAGGDAELHYMELRKQLDIALRELPALAVAVGD